MYITYSHPPPPPPPHTQMISAERIMAYSRLEPEASLETLPPHPQPPTGWPDKGGLEMEEVSFRYNDNYPLVLKSLSFSIKPSEKVGLLKWVGPLVGKHTNGECGYQLV